MLMIIEDGLKLHPNKDEKPRRMTYLYASEIKTLLQGKTREGKTVQIGERRRRRMLKRLEELNENR